MHSPTLAFLLLSSFRTQAIFIVFPAYPFCRYFLFSLSLFPAFLSFHLFSISELFAISTLFTIFDLFVWILLNRMVTAQINSTLLHSTIFLAAGFPSLAAKKLLTIPLFGFMIKTTIKRLLNLKNISDCKEKLA